jgi:hypothetical protein
VHSTCGRPLVQSPDDLQRSSLLSCYHAGSVLICRHDLEEEHASFAPLPRLCMSNPRPAGPQYKEGNTFSSHSLLFVTLSPSVDPPNYGVVFLGSDFHGS